MTKKLVGMLAGLALTVGGAAFAQAGAGGSSGGGASGGSASGAGASMGNGSAAPYAGGAGGNAASPASGSGGTANQAGSMSISSGQSTGTGATGITYSEPAKVHEDNARVKNQNNNVSGDTGASASGGMATAQDQNLATHHLVGRVLKVDGKTLYVEHRGAVIPLKTDKNTQFADARLKSAKDFQQGQDVRAAYVIQGTDNLVVSVSPRSATSSSSDTGANPSP